MASDDATLAFLIVEDDDLYAQYLEAIVRGVFGQDTRVAVVDAAADAVARLDAGEFDLCFLDYNLRQGTGMDVLRGVDADAMATAFIFLTAHSRTDLAVKAVQSGAADYLVKAKFDEFDLEKSVRYALFQHEKRRALRENALTDPLTGLANRRRFDDRLAHAIERARRRGERVGVLYIDIDGFKPVNDTHGHDTGDRLLEKIAARIIRQARRSDTAARLGGDEFALVLDGLAGAADLDRIADAMEAALAAPYSIVGARIEIGASIGCALFPDDGEDAETLTRASDQRMYAAKRNKSAARRG